MSDSLDLQQCQDHGCGMAGVPDPRAEVEAAEAAAGVQFARQLTKWMRELDVSFQDLGYWINKTDDSVRNYANGRTVPPLTTAVRIAAAMGVTLYELMEQDPPPKGAIRPPAAQHAPGGATATTPPPPPSPPPSPPPKRHRKLH